MSRATGMAVSNFIASMWKALGYGATSTTTHPAFIAARQRSLDWWLRRAPGTSRQSRERNPRVTHASTRLTAGFEYIGPAMEVTQAHRLLKGN